MVEGEEVVYGLSMVGKSRVNDREAARNLPQISNFLLLVLRLTARAGGQLTNEIYIYAGRQKIKKYLLADISTRVK